jgi:hypothetical protein
MKLRIACWWLLLGAFAVVGLVRWSQAFSTASPNFAPDGALDALARERFVLRDGAAVLRRELRAFPPDAPLLIFGPGNDWTLTEAYFLLSYLAWPRPVWCLGDTAPAARSRFDHPPPPGLRPAGLFFYKVAPPVELPTRLLSERLFLGKTGS